MSVEECFQELEKICTEGQAKEIYPNRFDKVLGVGAAGKVYLYRRG